MMKKLFHKPTAFLLALGFVVALGGIAMPEIVGAQAPSVPVTPGIPGNTLPGEQIGIPNIPTLGTGVGNCFLGSRYMGRMSENECNAKGTEARWVELTAQQINDAKKSDSNESCWFDAGCWAKKAVAGLAGGILLPLAGWLTWFSAMILNFVIEYTVLEMKKNLDIDSVKLIWKTIRDVGNMGFIFVLLYAAIMTIIGQGQNNQKLIVKIVVVAILINFSMFFTMFVIDAANILALIFYDAAAHGSLNSTSAYDKGGLANSLMEPLGLQTIWSISGNIDYGVIILASIMGTVVALIASFVFFAIAILFVIRFVVLLIVIALSPIAFLSFVLPQMNKYRDQWWGALSGQAFFAPIYFALTWIVIIIANNVLKPLQEGGSMTAAITGQANNAAQTAPDPTVVGIFVNYAIIITLLIASLTIAKDWANKTGGGMNKLTSWATGAAGGMTLGMAGRLGKNTVGRAGQALGENEWLKNKAKSGSFLASAALKSTRKVGGASFDIRGTGLNDQLQAGKAAGKGGFAEGVKKKSEAEAKFAASLAPSNKAILKAEEELRKTKEVDLSSKDFHVERLRERDNGRKEVEKLAQQARDEKDPERRKKIEEKLKIARIKFDATENGKDYKNYKEKEAQKRVDELKGVSVKEANRRKDKITEEEQEKLKPALEREKKLEEVVKNLEKLVEAETNPVEKKRKLDDLKIQKEQLELEKKEIAMTKNEYERQRAEVKTVPSTGDTRKEAYAKSVQDSKWAKFRGYNYEAAAKIRKGKSKEEKAKDVLKELVGDDDKEGEEEKPKTPPAAPAGGASPTP
jgi:hypothetical protein